MAELGHNGGPPLDDHEPEWGDGGAYTYFAWKRAHDAVWRNVSWDTMLRRQRRAEAIGLTYEEYTLEILERGRHLGEADQQRIAAIKASRVSPTLVRHGDGPLVVIARLSRVAAGRCGPAADRPHACRATDDAGSASLPPERLLISAPGHRYPPPAHMGARRGARSGCLERSGSRSTQGASDMSHHEPHASMSLRRKALASVAAVAIVASGAVGATLIEGHQPAFADSGPITVTTAQAPASFADVVDKVKPAVVSVKVNVEDVSADGSDDMSSNLDQLPPQLREFFQHFGQNGQNGQKGMPRPHRRGMALGSGFFISADGFVVTNNHVVEHAKKVQVTTDDGRTLDAKVIGTDSKSDLALLKVTEGSDFPYVKLAAQTPRVGDWVVAIGNPFGLGGTVTSGIVSARGRDIGAGPYDDFLQIDAPINKGNSGGPTFNLKGEVVGVNTAIASPSGGSVGLAFAIPASTVQSVVQQLESGSHQVTRGYLGVQIQAMTKDLAEGLGIADAKGALVNSTQADTPAAKAGLKSGDVIVSVNGDKIADARELTRRISGLKPGTQIDIGYLRDGQEKTAKVDLSTLPNTQTASLDEDDTSKSSLRLGLQLAPASRVGKGDEGVAVVNVDPDGPAAAKGISDGDVILDINGKSVSTPGEVAAGLKSAREEGKKAVLMRVKGRQGTRFVAIALSKKDG